MTTMVKTSMDDAVAGDVSLVKRPPVLSIRRMSEAEKRRLLSWLFSRFVAKEFYTFDDFIRRLLDSEFAHWADGVPLDASRMFAYMMILRMKKSVAKPLYQDQFPDHYISGCGWETHDLATVGVVPDILAGRPGGAFPSRHGVLNYSKWEFPTGFKWGPKAYFNGKKDPHVLTVSDPNDELEEDTVNSRIPSETEKLDLIISGMRATQWHKAVGELRTMVHTVGGTTPARAVGDTSPQQWELLEKLIERFIRDVESDGLHE